MVFWHNQVAKVGIINVNNWLTAFRITLRNCGKIRYNRAGTCTHGGI